MLGDSPDQLTKANLDRAFRLVRGGAALIGMHRNAWWLTKDGPTLDAGAFLVGLEYATERKARIVGKPSLESFRLGFERLAAEARERGEPRLLRREVAMVGDDVLIDIGGAQRAGLRGVFVRTGQARRRGAGGRGHPRAGPCPARTAWPHPSRRSSRLWVARADLQPDGRVTRTSSTPASTVESAPPSRASNRIRIVWPAQRSIDTAAVRQAPATTAPVPMRSQTIVCVPSAVSMIARRWSAAVPLARVREGETEGQPLPGRRRGV